MGGLELRIELIPKDLWDRNLRSDKFLGKARWDKLRRQFVNAAGDQCVICKSTSRLHGHEVWKYEETKRRATAVLVTVEIVCIDCHDIHHWARTVKLVESGVVSQHRFVALRKHFRKVNRCRQVDFNSHFLRSLRVWRRRSQRKWNIDWGSFKPHVEAAKAARENGLSRKPVRSTMQDQERSLSRWGRGRNR